jgi:hypothetical protein
MEIVCQLLHRAEGSGGRPQVGVALILLVFGIPSRNALAGSCSSCRGPGVLPGTVVG